MAMAVLRLSFLFRYSHYTGWSIGGFLGCFYSTFITFFRRLLELPWTRNLARSLPYRLEDLVRTMLRDQNICGKVHGGFGGMMITVDLDWAQGLYFYELVESVFTLFNYLFELRATQRGDRSDKKGDQRSIPYFSILVILFSVYSLRDTWYGTSTAYHFEDYLKAPTLVRHPSSSFFFFFL